MRGTHFAAGVEFTLETGKESYRQGEKIEGTLTIKNHGGNELPADFAVILSHADIKKVHKGDKAAFKTREEVNITGKKSVAPGSEAAFNWSHELAGDCPFTDKKASYFILYGLPGEEGNLQLQVDKKEIYDEYISILENFIRFKVKSEAWKKGVVELKCVPPASKEFATLDGMICELSLDADRNLTTKLTFKTKKLSYAGDADSQGVKVKSGNLVVEKSMGPKEYLIYGSSPNQDKIVAFLQESLDKVRAKTML